MEDDLTILLKEWSGGNKAALDKLLPAVYSELRRLAGHYLRHERPGHTFQATDLVHEAYVRLIDQQRVDWQNRAHFYGVAAQMMRRILVDHARRHISEKRGGGQPHLRLDEAIEAPSKLHREVVALDEALTRLAEIDPRKSRMVEFRFFGGLSVEETAAALGIAPATVMRDWALARAWLMREMDAKN
ncbi:MAG: sigma-70 family RNA polymerase sigma factor [Acidobacteriia bacterium]|nr:sigma-70 family RNA polymerase sigma factor [Terriglobia bacterium]